MSCSWLEMRDVLGGEWQVADALARQTVGGKAPGCFHSVPVAGVHVQGCVCWGKVCVGNQCSVACRYIPVQGVQVCLGQGEAVFCSYTRIGLMAGRRLCL